LNSKQRTYFCVKKKCREASEQGKKKGPSKLKEEEREGKLISGACRPGKGKKKGMEDRHEASGRAVNWEEGRRNTRGLRNTNREKGFFRTGKKEPA